MTDPIERRWRLVGQDALDVLQRALDGIGIRYRLPEGAVQVAERGEPAWIVERVEQVAETRAVTAEVLLRRVGGAETRLRGVEGVRVEHDDLPFMQWRKRCCGAYSSASWSVHRGRWVGGSRVLSDERGLAQRLVFGAGNNEIGRSSGRGRRNLPVT
ncbi:hypothetical protein [Tranquillimonas rosea]|uniref:hypothetical protein n=1 Tax=Tranquillimonas rosea TaxID=641238 RepID=UPI0011608C3D|nr:hypothetical protein [Tranquillimonas rosea]